MSDQENMPGKFRMPEGMTMREQAAYRLGILNFMLHVIEENGELRFSEETATSLEEAQREAFEHVTTLMSQVETDGNLVLTEEDLAEARQTLEDEATARARRFGQWGGDE